MAAVDNASLQNVLQNVVGLHVVYEQEQTVAGLFPKLTLWRGAPDLFEALEWLKTHVATIKDARIVWQSAVQCSVHTTVPAPSSPEEVPKQPAATTSTWWSHLVTPTTTAPSKSAQTRTVQFGVMAVSQLPPSVNTVPVVTGNTVPVVTGNTVAVVTVNTVPVVTGNTVPVVTGNTVPVVTGNTVAVVTAVDRTKMQNEEKEDEEYVQVPEGTTTVSPPPLLTVIPPADEHEPSLLINMVLIPTSGHPTTAAEALGGAPATRYRRLSDVSAACVHYPPLLSPTPAAPSPHQPPTAAAAPSPHQPPTAAAAPSIQPQLQGPEAPQPSVINNKDTTPLASAWQWAIKKMQVLVAADDEDDTEDEAPMDSEASDSDSNEDPRVVQARARQHARLYAQGMVVPPF